jgi:hypothetical protein
MTKQEARVGVGVFLNRADNGSILVGRRRVKEVSIWNLILVLKDKIVATFAFETWGVFYFVCLYFGWVC